MIQGIQLRILTAAQATDPPRTQDQGPRGRTARASGRTAACPRKCRLPTLQSGELRMWGHHLITSHGTEGFRCISCARIANHRRARYALRTLPCSGRAGLDGPLQPRRPRLKWNKANEARWKRQGEGGHQVVRYNTTQHDGKWLCMRCGLHYVRFCDLRTKQCAAASASQAATKAIADALAGGPLTRRKAHAFAKHPSGSRPGAPGARLPSDVLTLGPHAPRPAGPANPQAQDVIPIDLVGGPQGDDPQQGRPAAGDPAREEVLRPPEPPAIVGLGKSGPAHGAQDGDPLQHKPGAARPPPSDVPTGGNPEGHDPTSAGPQGPCPPGSGARLCVA